MDEKSCVIQYVLILQTLNSFSFPNDVCSNPGPTISPSMKGMRFFHLNICSIRNKLDELSLFCDEHKPHVLSLNETWLDDSFLDNELAIPGYIISFE